MIPITELIRNQYFIALLILFVSFIIARISLFILKKYIHKFALRTKTDIDDIILRIITKPLYIIIILIGLNTSLKTLTIPEPYSSIINKILFIIYVILITLAVSKVITALLVKWFKVQKKFEKTPRLISKIIKIVIYIIALLIILDHFDIDITPIVATLGIGALAIGLALQNTLSNLFAGLHLISDKPIIIGDFIQLENNVSGYVEDIGWRSTRIKTLQNTIVIIPNSKLAESIIINTSLQEPSIILQCGVSYDSNLEKVEKVTIDVAKNLQKKMKSIINEFEPEIRYHTFSDSNINFSITIRLSRIEDKNIVTHELIKELKKRYDKEKIEISYPIRKIYNGK